MVGHPQGFQDSTIVPFDQRMPIRRIGASEKPKYNGGGVGYDMTKVGDDGREITAKSGHLPQEDSGILPKPSR